MTKKAINLASSHPGKVKELEGQYQMTPLGIPDMKRKKRKNDSVKWISPPKKIDYSKDKIGYSKDKDRFRLYFT